MMPDDDKPKAKGGARAGAGRKPAKETRQAKAFRFKVSTIANLERLSLKHQKTQTAFLEDLINDEA